MNAVRGINIHEQLDVVGHDFQLQHLCPYFRTDLGNNRFKTHVNPINEYRSAVLWTPDDVIRARVHDVVI
jgi:hypothetical protein